MSTDIIPAHITSPTTYTVIAREDYQYNCIEIFCLGNYSTIAKATAAVEAHKKKVASMKEATSYDYSAFPCEIDVPIEIEADQAQYVEDGFPNLWLPANQQRDLWVPLPSSNHKRV